MSTYHSFNEMPIVLTADEVADILDISRPKVYELLRCGAIHNVKVGREYKVPKDAVMKYLQVSA